MSELRPVLERLAERATPPPDGFDRLERRRRRRSRNRRAMTVVLAMAVAIAGSLGAFAAFRHPGESTIGGVTTEFHALWPERTWAAAELSQAQVDSGDRDLLWRLDPVATAERFAGALGWQQVQATIQPGADAPNGVLVKVNGSTLPPTCPTPSAACQDSSTSGPSERSGALVLQQLVRADDTGIWSVVSVSGLIPLSILVGDSVVSGQEISVPFAVPDELAGTAEVAAGYTYVGRCSAVTTLSSVREAEGSISFHVGGSDFEEQCGGSSAAVGGSSASTDSAALTKPVDGYIFAELVVTGRTPTDPLTEHVSGDVLSFSAVPVHFMPASTASPELIPDVATISCDADVTNVVTPAVAAQPDGVHILVENTSGHDLDLSFKGIGGTGVKAGTSRVVWDLRPGTVGIRCLRPTADPGTAGGYVPLRVEDPSKLWVSPDLECGGGGAVGGAASFPEGATGEKGDPVEITRGTTNGLLASDVVEFAGYPKSEERQVRVVRGDSTVAVYHFMPDGQGGWLEDSYQACGDAGLGFGGSGSR